MMFGLFKKRVSAEYFGQALVPTIAGWVYADADRSLSALITEEEIISWIENAKILDLSPDVKELYRRFYIHHAIQSACTCFDRQTRHKITIGAMQLFKPAKGYDIYITLSYLENFFSNEAKVWTGFSKFNPPDALLHFLPIGYKDAGIKSSKILLNVFSFGSLKREKITDEIFLRHSLTMGSSISTTKRGIGHLFKSLKLE